MTMKTLDLPPINYLHECFDVVDGALFWRVRPREHFKTNRAFNMWNAKFSKKRAGRTMIGMDYRQVAISGVRYLEHRILAVIYGISTAEVIDHIDGDGLNNKRENLRSATQQENSRNSVGNSGKRLRVGVFSNGEKYTASIRIGETQRHLGTFETENEAVAARVGAERLFFGEFSVSEARLVNKCYGDRPGGEP